MANYNTAQLNLSAIKNLTAFGIQEPVLVRPATQRLSTTSSLTGLQQGSSSEDVANIRGSNQLCPRPTYGSLSLLVGPCWPWACCNPEGWMPESVSSVTNTADWVD